MSKKNKAKTKPEELEVEIEEEEDEEVVVPEDEDVDVLDKNGKKVKKGKKPCWLRRHWKKLAIGAGCLAAAAAGGVLTHFVIDRDDEDEDVCDYGDDAVYELGPGEDSDWAVLPEEARETEEV